MTEYVCGFMFDSLNPNLVALIRKRRPAWQEGRLNGIGGHIEPGETPQKAMVREFQEETGYWSTVMTWWPFATLSGPDFKVYFFKGTGDTSKLETKTDEDVVIIDKANVTVHNAIPNLTWLIPMALSLYHEKTYTFHITEEH